MTIDCAAVLASAYGVGLTEPPHFFLYPTLSIFCLRLCASIFLQLPAMDASARVTMKDAAKCDKHCELQNSVNQQNFERTLRLWATPEGMSASESPIYSFHQTLSGLGSMLCASAAKVLAHQDHQFVRRTPTRCSALRLLLGWRREDCCSRRFRCIATPRHEVRQDHALNLSI